MSKVNVIIKDSQEDISDEIESGKKVIILVEHSKAPVKIEVFKRYIERRFYKNIEDYIIVVKHKEQMPTNRLKPNYVSSVIEADMIKEYDEFMATYPKAIIEAEYCFHYCVDQTENGNGEIMSVAFMRTRDGFNKLEFSPIVPITNKEYEAIVNGAEDEESKLLNDIMTEKVIGDGLYGIVGYLTKGKFTTLDMYMQNLCDIVPILKKMQKRRSKVVKYKRHKINNKIYLLSIEKEKNTEVNTEELENALI